MSDYTFLTPATTDDFSRSMSRRSGRRSAFLNSMNVATAYNNAAYYDAIITATKQGKSEADAIQAAKGIIQKAEEEIQLNRLDAKVAPPNPTAVDSAEQKYQDQLEADDLDSDFSEDSEYQENVVFGQKSKKALSKLQSKLVQVGIFSNLKKESNQRTESLEMLNIKEVHKKLDITVDHYDSIMERVLKDTENQLESLFYQKLLETEDKFKAKLKLQYETLRSHKMCDSQIANLSKKMTIMKEEMEQLAKQNSNLSLELSDLRIYKSNAQSEEGFMSEKLANRKSYIQLLKKKLKKAQETLAFKSTDTQEDQTCHESYPSENEYSTHQDTINIPIDDDSEEDLADWYSNVHKVKPKWNISHKSESKKDIYSIMHNIEYSDDISEISKEGKIQLDSFSDDLLKNIEKKFKSQIDHLKSRLENERRNSRNMAMINTKRNIKMNSIIDILTECLEELQNDKKDTDLTVNNSETKSISSISSRIKGVEAIYERKELLKNLISGLNGQPVEYDYCSSTDKEDSQIHRSSIGIPSTKDMTNRTPIVPIQLKSEKSMKVKKKRVNEFNSVKNWVIAAKNKRSPSRPGIMTVSLIEKTQCEKIDAVESSTVVTKPEMESIMRRQRPISARTNMSQNSVRFAPNLEECSSNATIRRPNRNQSPIN